MSQAGEIEEAAAVWLMRREEPDWSFEDEARLEAWLALDPRHKVAFWELEYSWIQVGRLRPGSVGRWPLAAAAVLLAASLVFVVAGPVPWSLSAQTYRTDKGGRQTTPLKDGSKLDLDTATRVRAKIGAERREVWLEAGQVYFDVAHDASRPFVVHAGPRTITVLGTKFSVRRDGERVEVAVVEGRVRVDQAIALPGDIMLSEGEQTRLSLNAPQKVANELAWRDGMLAFDHATLADAAAEFNRYNQRQLVVEGASTAAMQVSGRFRADEPEAFGRIMNEVFHLALRQEEDRIVISASPR